MRGCRRMAGQRLGVADVDQPGHQLQRVDELGAGFATALMPKLRMLEPRPPMYLSDQRFFRAVRQRRVFDPGDLRMIAQIFGGLDGVLAVAVHPHRQRSMPGGSGSC